MQTWSEAFRQYIEARFPENPQKEAALSLGVPPSSVHYWCNGKLPRETTRRRISKWSRGDVPSELHVTPVATKVFSARRSA